MASAGRSGQRRASSDPVALRVPSPARVESRHRVLNSHVHPGATEKLQDDSFLFLDRPVVPEILRAIDLAPQFCAESLRIDALSPARRAPLAERTLRESRPAL